MKHARKLKTDATRLAQLAATACEHHAHLLARGYELRPSSGVWLTARRSLTVRLVYRHRPDPAAIDQTTITYVIRNVPWPDND